MNVDKEHIVGYFQNIIRICDRTTTGNLSHQMSNIRITYSYIADKIKEQYGEIMAYHNLMHAVELTSKVTTGIMGFLIWIVIGLTILYLSMVDDCEDFSSKVFVSLIYFSIFAAIALLLRAM